MRTCCRWTRVLLAVTVVVAGTVEGGSVVMVVVVVVVEIARLASHVLEETPVSGSALRARSMFVADIGSLGEQ
jgi:hypothetical protein